MRLVVREARTYEYNYRNVLNERQTKKSALSSHELTTACGLQSTTCNRDGEGKVAAR